MVLPATHHSSSSVFDATEKELGALSEQLKEHNCTLNIKQSTFDGNGSVDDLQAELCVYGNDGQPTVSEVLDYDNFTYCNVLPVFRPVGFKFNYQTRTGLHVGSL